MIRTRGVTKYKRAVRIEGGVSLDPKKSLPLGVLYIKIVKNNKNRQSMTARGYG